MHLNASTRVQYCPPLLQQSSTFWWWCSGHAERIVADAFLPFMTLQIF